ncbi:MAG TPA: hypothetical protein VLT36_15030 [Candidatus Dormibacteraeota bacterium]|nr:hypothetical protein [Candidatus Dormibacteraeota bacterium]
MSGLIKSGLDNQKYRWFKETAAVAQLWEASLMLVTALENTFLPHGAPDREAQPDQPTRDRWRARYRNALIRLGDAGIEVTADAQAGAEAYGMEEIDAAMSGKALTVAAPTRALATSSPNFE